MGGMYKSRGRPKKAEQIGRRVSCGSAFGNGAKAVQLAAEATTWIRRRGSDSHSPRSRKKGLTVSDITLDDDGGRVRSPPTCSAYRLL